MSLLLGWRSPPARRRRDGDVVGLARRWGSVATSPAPPARSSSPLRRVAWSADLPAPTSRLDGLWARLRFGSCWSRGRCWLTLAVVRVPRLAPAGGGVVVWANGLTAAGLRLLAVLAGPSPWSRRVPPRPTAPSPRPGFWSYLAGWCCRPRCRRGWSCWPADAPPPGSSAARRGRHRAARSRRQRRLVARGGGGHRRLPVTAYRRDRPSRPLPLAPGDHGQCPVAAVARRHRQRAELGRRPAGGVPTIAADRVRLDHRGLHRRRHRRCAGGGRLPPVPAVGGVAGGPGHQGVLGSGGAVPDRDGDQGGPAPCGGRCRLERRRPHHRGRLGGRIGPPRRGGPRRPTGDGPVVARPSALRPRREPVAPVVELAGDRRRRFWG